MPLWRLGGCARTRSPPNLGAASASTAKSLGMGPHKATKAWPTPAGAHTAGAHMAGAHTASG